MKTLVVDDSRLARVELIELLKAHPSIEVVGEAHDVQSAIEAIDKHQVELVMLDIHLPDGTGYDVLDKCDHTPQVIFTTAYEQHAVQAFEANALDYLLKPVTAERLAVALQRADGNRPQLSNEAIDADSQIFIRDGERCFFVKLREIYLVNVEGNHVRVFFRGQKAFLARSLSYVESKLAGLQFFRANRQQIINLDYVKAIEPMIGDGLQVELKNGVQIEVSRRQARELKQRMEL
jgi:two-component system LytT family response regulator